MPILTFEGLTEILREADPYAYSGRGMYGRQCVAVNTNDEYNNPFKLLAALADGCDQRELAEIIKNVRTDSMGLGTVLYWPCVTWVSAGHGRSTL